MKSVLIKSLGAILFLMAGVANASIIYNIDRVVGSGSVSGFIETDGTLGLLSNTNILSWEVSVFSPDVNGGVASEASTGGTIFGDNALIADANDLFFDFDLNQNWGMYTDSSSWWCLAGGPGGDNGCFDSPGELIGYSDITGNEAEFSSLTGLIAITSESVTVPAPTTLTLFAFASLILMRRKKIV
ncbi:MAG: hypothetical protein ABJV04_16740 [Aliiglaciecola sp.]|uniref:hypothetical protein n=1 Tax=Aliiglaciecola sp. TaxID=1872441 RepID=UPI0032983C0E